MENKAPLVSILMTSYNREKYIAEAIESVLTSTYTNWELLIVDDVSKDSTIEIARKYEGSDSRIRVYVNDTNLGDYPNRNKAATYAKGKYIKYLDSDDLLLPYGLQYCVEQMEKYPTACIGMWLVNHDETVDSILVSSSNIIRDHYFKRPYLNIGPTGTIIRREAFEAINGFDTRFKMASDNYFNLQIALKGPIVLLTKEFIFYRVHEGQELNNPTGYLIHNYLYSKEFFDSSHIPFSAREKKFLREKLDKRHSVNLSKFFFKAKSIGKVLKIMESTGYTIPQFLRGFFY